MSLILDHVNGVHDDNRLENLRIVCPNCNATLDTHCGSNEPRSDRDRACLHCGAVFFPPRATALLLAACGPRRAPNPAPGRPPRQRPPYEQLVREIDALGYAGVGRPLRRERQRGPQVAANLRIRWPGRPLTCVP